MKNAPSSDGSQDLCNLVQYWQSIIDETLDLYNDFSVARSRDGKFEYAWVRTWQHKNSGFFLTS